MDIGFQKIRSRVSSLNVRRCCCHFRWHGRSSRRCHWCRFVAKSSRQWL